MIDGLFKKYGPEGTGNLGLRETNFAQARLGILWAMIELMEKKSFDDISVRDLCRLARVSEPSFYNYFPRKDDLFLYFIGLWSIDAQLHAESKKAGIERIREVYLHTADQIANSGAALMKEIIAYQARTDVAARAREARPLTLAEKFLVFGEVAGIDQIPNQGLGVILETNLTQAISQGEISGDIDKEAVMAILGSLFFGLPVLFLHTRPDKVRAAFTRALDLIFKECI